MFNLLIDPFLLCLPTSCPFEDQITTFVHQLTEWSGISRDEEIQLLILERCIEILIEEENYPYTHQIRASLRQYDIGVDATSVCTLAQKIMDRLTPYIEEFTGINDILTFDNPIILPGKLLDRLSENLTLYATKQALIVALSMTPLQKIGTIIEDPTYFATAQMDDFVAQEIAISSTVTFIEPYKLNSRITEIELPVEINTKLDLCCSHADLLRVIGPITLWNTTRSEDSLKKAINQTVDEIFHAIKLPKVQRTEFLFGKHFISSLLSIDFGSRNDYMRLLFEVCAFLIVNKPKNKISAFRSSANSKAAQMTRDDGALAFRTHLTKDHEAYRLMFWKLPNGSLEFANIGPKKELTIH